MISFTELIKMRTFLAIIFYVYSFTSRQVNADEVFSQRNMFKENNYANSPAKFIGNFYKSGGSGLLVNGIHYILNGANLSESCSQSVDQFRKQIASTLTRPSVHTDKETNPGELEPWALQMLDAWPKIPDGVLSGHVNALGDYDECLAVRAFSSEVENFRGKYCLLYVLPNFPQSKQAQSVLRETGERSIENLLQILSVTVQGELPAIPSYGACLPSTCSDEEIFQIVSTILDKVNLTTVASFCSVEEPIKFSLGAIITISILGVLVLCVIVATLIEVFIRRSISLQKTPWITSKTFTILQSFSFTKNLARLLDTDANNDISCLHGLRFLGASWVVLCHTYLCGTQLQPVHNLVDAYSYLTSGIFSVFVVNAGIVVDIFLVIGGFLVSLTLLSTLTKSKGKINLAILYINRYCRITPLYGVIILMGTFIFPMLGSGPYWHVAKTWAGFCEQNWWKNLLYVNNLPIYDTLRNPGDAPCHGIAWYLGVDMQLFLLSPFLVYPIWKWKLYGSVPLLGITLVSIILPGLLTYLNDFLPLPVPFVSGQNRFSQLAYTPTYMRATPYFIGMCTGLLFHYTKNKKTIGKNKAFNITAAWLMSIAVASAVLLSPQKFLVSQYHFKKLESAIYVSGHRTAWALAISWLIYACGTGNGGWINQFLSWKPFVPLGRLTFAIYLVSLHLQFMFHLQYRQPTYFSNYLMVNLFFSHLLMSIFVAFLCVILVEAPAMNLQKVFLPSKKEAKVEKIGHNQASSNIGRIEINTVSTTSIGNSNNSRSTS